MDVNQIESQLKEIKERIPVNTALKKELRQTFKPKKKSNLLKKFAVIAAAAAVLCMGIIVTNDRFVENVSAASLKISNYISFIDLGAGQSLDITEHQGTLYLPVFGKGLYAYDQTGYHPLYNKEVNSAKISTDGKKLVLSAGSLQILDVKSGIATVLLQPEDESTYYEEPSWSVDGAKVLFTKKVIQPGETHGFTVKECGIYEIELATQQIKKITDGSYASYVPNANAILFERENRIILKNLEDQGESIVDSGRFPSISPDGNYIAYVKVQTETIALTSEKNAKVEASVDNVWIADRMNLAVKKQVTSNYPYEFQDAAEWFKTLGTSELPQVLSYSGTFSYYSPVWSSDGSSLYALRNSNRNEGGSHGMKLIRIDFSQEKLTAQETIKQFIQALILRDDDYAKSLMKSPPQLLTISNPKQVGYQILSSGKEGDRAFVDAEVYWQYTANAYYRMERSRYYLSEAENGYIIDEIKQLATQDAYSKEDGVVYLRDGSPSSQQNTAENEQKTILFKESNIPSQYLPEGEHRISSLYWNDKAKSLAFVIQETDADSWLYLLTYDLNTKKFTLIDKMKNSSSVFLTSDNAFKYLALDYSYGENYANASSNLYALENGTKIDLRSLFEDSKIDNLHSDYWDGEQLVFEVNKDDLTLRYIYLPAKNAKKSY